MSEIQPALTPQEWTDLSVDIAIGLVSATLTDNPAVVTGDMEAVGTTTPYVQLSWSLASDTIATDRPHGLAALCLYQHPFGFTREDVTSLRAVADHLIIWEAELRERDKISAEDDYDLVIHADRLFTIAARIAALLPPSSP